MMFIFISKIFNYCLIIITLTTYFSLDSLNDSIFATVVFRCIHSVSHEIQPPNRGYLHCLQCQLTHNIFKRLSVIVVPVSRQLYQTAMKPHRSLSKQCPSMEADETIGGYILPLCMLYVLRLFNN